MYRRILTAVAVSVGVIASGGAAFAVATSVSTTPDPAFISPIDKSVVSEDQARHENHGGLPSHLSNQSSTATATTFDDNGVDNPAANPAAADNGVDNPPENPGADDNDVDNPAANPAAHDNDIDPTVTSGATATVDDHGGDTSGSSDDGSGSGHSGGTDDSSSSGSSHG